MEINKINSNSFQGGVYVKPTGMTKIQRNRADWLMDKMSYLVDIPEDIDILLSKSKKGKNRLMVQFLENGYLIRYPQTNKTLSLSAPFESVDCLRTRNPFICRIKQALNKAVNLDSCVDYERRPDVSISKIIEQENNQIEKYGLLEDLEKRFSFCLPIKIKK